MTTRKLKHLARIGGYIIAPVVAVSLNSMVDRRFWRSGLIPNERGGAMETTIPILAHIRKIHAKESDQKLPISFAP